MTTPARLRLGSDPVLLPGLLVAILPIVAVNLCLWISIEAETIPRCIPYLEGCTSVSAAGRNPPAVFLFRAVMLPVAAALVLFWFIHDRWLDLLRDETDSSSRAILWLGVIGAIFLTLYVTYLGSEGDFARLMRRYGIFVYFGFTALAQLLTARELLESGRRRADALLRRYGRGILWLCVAMLLMGLTNVVLKAILVDPDRAENIIEWNFALLMQACFLIVWRAWKYTGLRATLTVAGPGRGA